MELSDSSKLNGSSGFISYDETSFDKSYSETSQKIETSVEYSLQNERNHRLATLRRRLVTSDGERTPQKELPPPLHTSSLTDPRSRRRRSAQEALSDYKPEDLERARRSVNYYKQFGDFWNKFPKTDYTYSPSSPWYRDEVAPGIRRIPNMCRRSYRSHQSSSPSSPVPTPPTSESDDSFRSRYFDKSFDYEESWFTYIRRVVRTTTTTVVTTVYKSVFPRAAGPDENVPESRKWLVWLLLAFLLALAGYCLFGSDSSSKQVSDLPYLAFAAASSYLRAAAAALSRPYCSLWALASYVATLFLNTVALLPSFFSYTNETNTISPGLDSSQIVWLTETIRDIVESMDPHDFRISPEEENRLVDRVSDKVASRMQELEDKFEALKADVQREISSLSSSDQQAIENIISSGLDMSQMMWLKDAVRDIVKSMDPPDFRTSPKEESQFSDKVDQVATRMQELEEKLEALKVDVSASNQKLETIKNHQEEQDQSIAEQYSSLTAIQQQINKIKELSSKGVSSDRGMDIPMDFRASMKAIAEELLEKYHADRTGKTDYALLSNGGAIASIRCTRPYKDGSREYELWNLFTWEFTNSPDIILKPGILPGECWAFEGANGYLAIRLSIPIYIEGFTMEHTPRELSPYGHIKSAPRKFSVWGLESLVDREETFLGRFEFLENGKSLQSYDAVIVDRPFHLVELRIESNHGHLEYTCLYRFRVHGRPALGSPQHIGP